MRREDEDSPIEGPPSAELKLLRAEIRVLRGLVGAASMLAIGAALLAVWLHRTPPAPARTDRIQTRQLVIVDSLGTLVGEFSSVQGFPKLIVGREGLGDPRIALGVLGHGPQLNVLQAGADGPSARTSISPGAIHLSRSEVVSVYLNATDRLMPGVWVMFDSLRYGFPDPERDRPRRPER